MTSPLAFASQFVDQLADLIAEKVAVRLERSLGDEVLTAKQAAKLLQIHVNTVLDMAGRGVIPGKKLGRDWRFLRSELLDHVRTSVNAR
ncbi:excisionase family DNA binding protein [Deinococcus metalli]|uniref:Excisionase family DNA binding protein n=1 Tax=Deinococcus metalli TaxID=1141878 RepID=A0A7W8KJY1_9DEIO|nr:helix-turn-helix domain-containing protein [Deinococcus metalli]MBB5379198.1 excisionase family DNA binding protein [Deinococcus metalli]GHF65175.1 hypothetical protein GCM10017781_46140 [Deinococcus metalli]